MSNQKPNSVSEFSAGISDSKTVIKFDAEGICAACRFAENKSAVDWEMRLQELEELCDRYRSKDGSYDCVVPGSGGKDSIYASLVLRDRFKMHPLTVTWAPHLYTDWGRDNFDSWISAGLSNVLVTPNRRLHRLVTRVALENLLHPFQPFIIGQKVLAPKLAKKFGIPLVFYGEPQVEYGNPKTEENVALKPTSYFASSKSESKPLRLGGINVNTFAETVPAWEADLENYLPMTDEDIFRAGVEFHYLGYYLRWHPQSCYYYAVENCGFRASPERTTGTYSKYISIDDKLDDLHYYTTFIKFGIGRATYDAAQEIRSADINRDEGIALVKRYDGEWPERFMPELMSYLSLSKEEFPELGDLVEDRDMTVERFKVLCDEFRSPHLWDRNKQTKDWELRHAVWH